MSHWSTIGALTLAIGMILAGCYLLNLVASRIIVLFPELTDRLGGPLRIRLISCVVAVASVIVGLCL